MKRERNIIKINKHGNISMPIDMRTTSMSEWEICELFGITTMTFRVAVKAIYKSGVLRDSEVKPNIRLPDKCSIDVYGLEMVVALAFRIGTYGAKQVRQALLERITHERKENSIIFLSLNVGSHIVMKSCRTVVLESLNL